MQSTPKISVIIAVFNAEKTLTRCLDSVLQQSFTDFEVIAVDDGSYDTSWSILSSYKQRDSRIRVFRQANKGISQTRQTGLDYAVGEYTIHLDADDWIEPELLAQMVTSAKNTMADMVMCGFINHTEAGLETDMQIPCSKDPDALFGQLLKGKLHGSLCNKLIRREVYQTYGIGFPKDIDCGEDLYVCLSLLSRRIEVEYVPLALYHYDKTGNESSITNKWYDYPMQKRVALIRAIEPLVSADNARAFNTYAGRIAYDALFCKKEFCPDFPRLFRPYSKRIVMSSLPMTKRMLVLLGLCHVRLPLRQIRAILHPKQ